MNLRTCGRFVTALACAAAGTAAAQGQGILPDGYTRSYDLPAAFQSAAPDDLAYVDLTGDVRGDLVMAHGGALWVQWSPDAYPTWVEVSSAISGTNVQAVEVLGELGSPGQILVAANSGVKFLDYEPASQLFRVAATPLTGSWAGCTDLEVADLDADGTLDLLALDATGSQLKRALDIEGARTELASLTLTPAAVEVFSIEYDGDVNTSEFVVRTASSVAVYSGIGTQPIATASHVGVSAAAAVDQLSGRQRLVYISVNALGESHVQSIDAVDGASIPEFVDRNITGMASGEYTGDDYGDLILTSDLDYYVVAWAHSGTATMPFQVGPDSQLVLAGPATPSGAVHTSPPLLADLDHDGDLDLLLTEGQTPTMFIQRNPMKNETDQWVTVELDPALETPYLLNIVPGRLDLQMIFYRPIQIELSAYDGIQVVAWREETPGAGIQGAPEFDVVIDYTPADPAALDVEFKLFEPVLLFDAKYTFALRLIARDVRAKIFAASPFSFWGFSPVAANFPTTLEPFSYNDNAGPATAAGQPDGTVGGGTSDGHVPPGAGGGG